MRACRATRYELFRHMLTRMRILMLRARLSAMPLRYYARCRHAAAFALDARFATMMSRHDAMSARAMPVAMALLLRCRHYFD